MGHLPLNDGHGPVDLHDEKICFLPFLHERRFTSFIYLSKIGAHGWEPSPL